MQRCMNNRINVGLLIGVKRIDWDVFFLFLSKATLRGGLCFLNFPLSLPKGMLLNKEHAALPATYPKEKPELTRKMAEFFQYSAICFTQGERDGGGLMPQSLDRPDM